MNMLFWVPTRLNSNINDHYKPKCDMKGFIVITKKEKNPTYKPMAKPKKILGC